MKFAAPFFIAAGLLANLAIAQSGKTPYVPGRGSSGSNGNGNGQGYTPYSQWNSPAGSRASGSSSLPSYESRPPYSPPATDPGYDLTCGSITMLCGPGGADCRCSATGVTTCYSEDHPSFIQCNQLCSCRPKQTLAAAPPGQSSEPQTDQECQNQAARMSNRDQARAFLQRCLDRIRRGGRSGRSGGTSGGSGRRSGRS